MNRIDRLFAILLILQNKSLVRSQDLADRFEVSQRTIYRDIAALSEVGVPIAAMPGEGYQLLEGFYLPPLVFSEQEATALILGAEMLRAQAAGELRQEATSAAMKITNILPGKISQRVRLLAGIIQFFVSGQRFDLDDPRLIQLQTAIIERRVAQIGYHSRNRDHYTEREVEPLQLTYSEGTWYVSGFCRLRQDSRSFRLDRIEELRVLGEQFAPRPPKLPEAGEAITVQVRFNAEVARWVRERQHYAFQGEEVLPGGQGVLMRYCVESVGEIKNWLLGWGAGAETLSPVSLRDAIREEAKKLIQMLT